MVAVGAYTFVFLAGLVTALATGLGAVPFFLFDDIGDRWNVALWGLASGIMLAASLFGLVTEGLRVADGGLVPVGVGFLAGVVLVVLAHDVLMDAHVDPREYEEADFRRLVLILGVLTVHSFPEGVAVGVSFAELSWSGAAGGAAAAGGTAGSAGGAGLPLFGYSVPLLAVFMTVAISIHNIPEGVAISIPLRSLGVSEPRMVWWAVFSSLPQPIGAVLAFAFVRLAREFLPVGFGFAAGAMVYLVLSEFVPEALAIGRGLPGRGYRELAAGLGLGVLVMVPLAFVQV